MRIDPSRTSRMRWHESSRSKEYQKTDERTDVMIPVAVLPSPDILCMHVRGEGGSLRVE